MSIYKIRKWLNDATQEKKNKPNPNPADDRQEIIKIKAAINEMETKKTTQRINDSKAGSPRKARTTDS